MVNQQDALKILNREKNYEDHLVTVISEYLESCVGDMIDVDNDEADEVRHILSTIASDSQVHSTMFAGLVQMVYEHGEGKY